MAEQITGELRSNSPVICNDPIAGSRPAYVNGWVSTKIYPDDGNQRYAQGIETAQQTLQSCLVERTGQGGDRLGIWLAIDYNGQLPAPVCPTLIEVSWYFDLICCKPVQGESWFSVRHPLRLSILTGLIPSHCDDYFAKGHSIPGGSYG